MYSVEKTAPMGPCTALIGSQLVEFENLLRDMISRQAELSTSFGGDIRSPVQCGIFDSLVELGILFLEIFPKMAARFSSFSSVFSMRRKIEQMHIIMER